MRDRNGKKSSFNSVHSYGIGYMNVMKTWGGKSYTRIGQTLLVIIFEEGKKKNIEWQGFQT